MRGFHSRMALILSVATISGVHVARQAESHLARWRLANAFVDETAAADSGESRYSIVVRANGEDLIEDETTIGVLKLAAGPLRFDIALYDECQLRSSNQPVEDSSSDLDRSDRVITVFVDPAEDVLTEDCPEMIELPETIELQDPAWVHVPSIDKPATAG